MNKSLTPIRVIMDPPASGSWNMAVDQAILESLIQRDAPTFRIYDWQPATLSLGYFQSFDDRKNHKESLSCPAVRRSSGGGAIIHDKEITYSLTLPSSNRWATRNTEIYSIVHNAIVSIMADYSLTLKPFVDNVDPKPASPNSFLCFQRRHSGDLIYEGYKVVGSAQRRSRQAVLQHGSILLETSEFAPQLPGLFQLSNVTIDKSEIVERMINVVCSVLGFDQQHDRLSATETASATAINEKKFAVDAWNILRKKLN